MEALQVRAAYKVKDTFKKLNASTASDNEKQNTLFGTDIISLSHSHIDYATFLSFYTNI